MAAAACAAEQGARVVLVDEGPHPGGQIWRASLTQSVAVRSRVAGAIDSTASGATVSSSTSVVDVQRVGCEWIRGHRERDGTGSLRIEARRLILATGARERFLPFPGWTLPNVFGIGGAQALLKTGMSFRGQRVVIAGSGPLLLPGGGRRSRGGRQTRARRGAGAGSPRRGLRGVALAQPVDARAGGDSSGLRS